MRILTVIGTRPEAIKMAPVALAAARRPEIDHLIVTTGQHGRLIDQALAGFGVRADIDLALGRARGALAFQVGRIAHAVAQVIDRCQPDMVLVQGDTTSAYAAARAAQLCGVPLGHVEAGLRSGDLDQPYPEEGNRIAIDRIATMLFAPSDLAVANLAAEGLGGRVIKTGNTGIDALLEMRRRIAMEPDLPGRLPAVRGKRLVVATCHRRENLPALPAVCAALARIGARGDVIVVMPVHPNAEVRAIAHGVLAGQRGIKLVRPLRYAAMVRLLDQCALLLTDSGGLQEEACAFGRPTLVLRNVTERQEGLATGNLRLVGTEEERIVAETEALLGTPDAHRAMSIPAFPFGDGRAAEAVLDAIAVRFAGPQLTSAMDLPASDLSSEVA